MKERRKDNKNRVLKAGEYQRANGTYEYKYTDKNGKRQSEYAKTLNELREKEAAILEKQLRGIKTGCKSLTVNDMYKTWLKVKRGLKDNTFQNYKFSYEQYAKKEIGKKKICDLKKTDVKAFYNTLYDEYHLSISSIDSVHTVIHQVLEMAVEDSYIYTNPSSGALTELKKAHNFEIEKKRALTVEEQSLFDKFLSKKNSSYQRWYPIFTVMVLTGMRVGEICGLRWEDIDLEEGTISVNHTLVYYKKGEDNKCGFVIHTPKTEAGVRIIPMLPKVKEAFLKEKQYQEEVGLKCKAKIDGYTDFIFINRFGNTQHQGTLNKALRRIIRDCNYDVLESNSDSDTDIITLPPFSCHSLRHTFATRMCEANVNLKAIQSILGHKDIETTLDIYTDATKRIKDKGIRTLDEYFKDMI